MKILALGDLVGPASVRELEKRLWQFRKDNGIDFVVANCENASEGNGLAREDAEQILKAGVDVITSGNHIFRKGSVCKFLDTSKDIIRPANYPSTCPGMGYTINPSAGIRILVMNVMGCVYMDALDNPFDAIEKILKACEGEYDLSILDIHAEATSEKLAIANYFDGRIDIIFGTHTHVPTADERILKGGSAYVTDLGMGGGVDSILGIRCDIIIKKFITRMPVKFETQENDIEFTGVIVKTSQNNKPESITRVKF